MRNVPLTTKNHIAKCKVNLSQGMNTMQFNSPLCAHNLEFETHTHTHTRLKICYFVTDNVCLQIRDNR